MSRSSTLTHSLILCIVSLTTPSSIVSAPVGAINRPSEVPPPVEHIVSMPAISFIAAVAASIKEP